MVFGNVDFLDVSTEYYSGKGLINPFNHVSAGLGPGTQTWYRVCLKLTFLLCLCSIDMTQSLHGILLGT